MADLVDRVRADCARVMENPRFVTIDHDSLGRYLIPQADALTDSPSVHREQTPPPELVEGEAMLVFALDAINFGSGYHDLVTKRPGCSGSVTMSTALTEFVTENGPLTATQLCAFTMSDCSQLFGQEPDGGAVEELMARFSTALSDLGHFVLEHGNAALGIIDAANSSAVALAESLTEMPFYRDVEMLDSDEVAFYKRAQITAADLHRRLGPAAPFNDLHRLTAFADNLVPHVLRVDGVLRYDQDLTRQIDAGIPLEPGSRAEIEIRAAGVHAVELLANREARRPMDIDEALWHRGAGARYKAIPRHRARSVFY